jgi:probable 2-oxoglutarate dehydrogenase E1 component DHKTD1
MCPETTFHPVLDDEIQPEKVQRVVFCSGKHFYSLAKHRQNENIRNTAIIRLECLCPFPAEELKQCLASYPHAAEFIWSQEEHLNMGAWSFVRPRFESQLGVQLTYAGRGPLAAPAVGHTVRHKDEERALLADTFQR